MAFHSAETAGSIHIVNQFSYASEAARLAATPAASDVGKVARQTDNETYWVLIDDSPLTWAPIQAGMVQEIVNKVANYTATIADEFITVDASGGAVSITLPAASARKRQKLTIKKVDASANAVTISRAGADTIDGATSQSLPGQYDSYSLVSDGVSAWYLF